MPLVSTAAVSKENWEIITRAGPIITDGVMQDLGDKKIKDPLTEV